MDKINLHKAAKLTSPNPVTMVCTRKEDGATNLATVSWWTYLSYHPNLIAFAMAKESYSGERVRQSKEVIVTVPGAALAQAAMGCGSYSGREMDKAAQYDIALMPVEGSGIQIPVHSRLAMVCRLQEYHEAGDHYLYICQVDAVYGNAEEPALFAWNGYTQLRPVE